MAFFEHCGDPGGASSCVAVQIPEAGADALAKALAEAVALNYEVPVSKYAFRQRFTAEERYAMDAFNAGYEANAQLTDQQRAAIRTALNDFNAADYVHLSLALPALQMYEALGLIAAGRAAVIGAP